MRVLSKKELYLGIFLTLGISGLLAFSFIPTSQHLVRLALQPFFPAHDFAQKVLTLSSFLILSYLFYVSVPKRNQRTQKTNIQIIQISLLPLFIAFVFGLIHPSPSLLMHWRGESSALTLLWYWFLVPTGEELLFRGWLYELVERFWSKAYLSRTFPFPASLWLTSLAFSIWHIQNFSHNSWALVSFQVVYTFFTGLWLGYLHWQTGKLRAPILGHFLLNALSTV